MDKAPEVPILTESSTEHLVTNILALNAAEEQLNRVA